ncbi:hypothetical protein QTP88_008364 [Uroleucon formosanum]
MGGPGETVPIDDSLLHGKRSEKDNQPVNNRNYGRRIEGPWVFGLCWNNGNVLERRFLIVERRDKNTLILSYKEKFCRGTTIVSNEWKSYSSVNSK